MNGDEAKKLVSKHSYISIGLAIVLLGGVFVMTRQSTEVAAKVYEVDQRTLGLDEKFVPRREIDLRLTNIEGGIERIEKLITK